MYVTINMYMLKIKIQALTLVGIVTNDKCNILHVAHEDEPFKSKHAVQYTLCHISCACEQQEHHSHTKLFFPTMIKSTDIKLSTVGHICNTSSIIHNMLLSELPIGTVLKQL